MGGVAGEGVGAVAGNAERESGTRVRLIPCCSDVTILTDVG